MSRLYEKLIGLVEKLPSGLQKPILKELVPIQQFFLDQRPPRIVLLGARIGGDADVFRVFLPPEFFENPPAEQPGKPGAENREPVLREPVDTNWERISRKNRTGVDLLDLRGDFHLQAFTDACINHRPDAIVFFQKSSEPSVQEFARAVSAAFVPGGEGPPPGVFGVCEAGVRGAPEQLLASLRASRDLSHFPVRVFSSDRPADLAEAVAGSLPNQARLPFALLFEARKARAEIAASLLKSFTAVGGVIGMQPIPLADLPVLAGLQSLMVGMIAYTGGRRMGPRAVTEFLGAVGVSVGAGMIFREAARALIRIVPIWGNAVSGVVAGAGTYAIGRAAIAYFVEDTPLQEARKLFLMLKPKGGLFQKKKKIPPVGELAGPGGKRKS